MAQVGLLEAVEPFWVAFVDIGPGGEGVAVLLDAASDTCDQLNRVVFMDAGAAELLVVVDGPFLGVRFAGAGQYGVDVG